MNNRNQGWENSENKEDFMIFFDPKRKARSEGVLPNLFFSRRV